MEASISEFSLNKHQVEYLENNFKYVNDHIQNLKIYMYLLLIVMLTQVNANAHHILNSVDVKFQKWMLSS